MMKIEKALPPNIAAIEKQFDVRGKPILFAYGDTIFNPTGVSVSPELLRHEITHSIQQQEAGVEMWWEHYLEDRTFRLSQEIPAHQNEYLAHLERRPSRHERRALLTVIAKRLSGPLYGKLISLDEAKQLLNLEKVNLR